VPNLIANRGFWVTSGTVRLNVRRLMYQTLIWPAELRDDARGLGAAVNTEDMKRLSNPLVDGVRRYPELCGDFLGTQMLIDKAQAIELARREPSNAIRHPFVCFLSRRPPSRVRQAVSIPQINPHLAQHRALPSSESAILRSSEVISPEFPQNFAELPDSALTLIKLN